MDNDCYVLMIDILGFTELVKRERENPNKILDIITKFLGCYEGIEAKDNLSSIYFSDTAILWQKNPSKEDFLKFSIASVLMCSNLLANRIPCRGAIAHGPFIVKRDRRNKHDIFFGEALIEAYKAQAKENWIGVTVCPSAVKYAGPKIIKRFSDGHFLKRDERIVLLNPFLAIQRVYESRNQEVVNQGLGWVKGSPHELFFSIELLAFKFILDKALEFTNDRDFTSKVACKYYATVSFLRKVLHSGCFEWAQKMCSFVEMKFGKPRIID
jgi:hypothetical protein